MVSFERALVSFYRSSIVTVPLSLRVSEILPLLFSSMSLFPYTPLVSLKFPHVPLELQVDRLLRICERANLRVGLIVRAISFQHFQPM